MVKIHASPNILTDVYMCVFYFTAFHEKWNRLQSPSAPPQGALLPILGFNLQLCLKQTSANSKELLVVSVQLSKQPHCCTWEQQLFSFGSKKAGWASGTEKLQVQIEFSRCNFLYRTLTAQQLTHLLTEKTAKAEDTTIAKTCSSHQLFKS